MKRSSDKDTYTIEAQVPASHQQELATLNSLEYVILLGERIFLYRLVYMSDLLLLLTLNVF